MEQNTTINPPKARQHSRKWSNTQANTLQTREKALRIGADSDDKPSKRETILSQMEQYAGQHPPNARQHSRKWSNTQANTLQTREKALEIGEFKIRMTNIYYANAHYSITLIYMLS